MEPQSAKTAETVLVWEWQEGKKLSWQEGELKSTTSCPGHCRRGYSAGVTKTPEISVHPWGVPGEEHKIIVAPVFKGTAGPTDADIRGQPGKYRVQFLLARPGYPIRREREHAFIDNLVGTSQVRIVKPEAERGLSDAERVVLQLLGKTCQIIGIPD